ncbi:hypothetical protein KCP73_20780 [Salmonella enterica subsp. enterica]|nr:hypothetical protein KCP73_20780 [Salmonella enterica subsp. enterica]
MNVNAGDQPYASRIGETGSTFPMAQAVSMLRELCPECAYAADAFRRTASAD